MADRCPTCDKPHNYGAIPYERLGELRAEFAAGTSQSALARRHGTSQGNVWKAIHSAKNKCRPCCAREHGYANRGREHSEETRAKLRAAREGRKPSLGMKHSPEWVEMIRKVNSRPATEETREKMRAAARKRWGPKPKGLDKQLLARWAYEVIKRDHATCQYCGFVKTKKKSVCAHHVLSKSKHPDRAYSVLNGITLCRPCHREEHRINGTI